MIPLTVPPTFRPWRGRSADYPSSQDVALGYDTAIGEFPFLALLGIYEEEPIKDLRTPFFFNCYGSIINKWFVLSAGHCGPTVHFVRLGEWRVVDPDTENDCEEYLIFNDCGGLRGEESDDCERCQNVKKKIDCETVNGVDICTEPYQVGVPA